MKTLQLGTGRLIADLIPRSHAHLRVVRMFLPFETTAGELVPWSRFASANRPFSASTTWTELLDAAGERTADYHPACGYLDEQTAVELRALIGERTMTGLFWRGYAGASGEADYQATTWSNATEHYISRRFTAADLQPDVQVPEFAWDDAGELAWGAFLYPDSLAVAAVPSLLNVLIGSVHLTATPANTHDTMPASSGD